MPTDGLLAVYKCFDVSAAMWVADLLAERGIAAHLLQTGPGGSPYFGHVEAQVMVLRSDAEAHREEILEAIREVESELQNG